MSHEPEEREMRSTRRLRAVRAGLIALIIGAAITGTGWSQPAAPLARADDPPALTAMAAVAGAIGSFFYIPFKVGAICPGMALASGASLAVTGGDRGTAEYLLRVGCTGTYFITPGMVRGREEFQGSGAR